MDSSSPILYALLVFCLFGGGFFAATEIAYASANKIRLKNYAENGDRQAKKALYILNNFDRALTTLLIGNNVMHIGCASLATLLATKLWGKGAVGLTTLVTTVVVFFISEMLPKSYAKSHAERFALGASGPLCFLMKALRPLVFLFSSLSSLLASLFRKDAAEPTVTEDELYDIIETIQEEGSMEPEKGKLVASALEFADFTVQDVLTSRVDMVALDLSSSPEEIMELIQKNKYSRLPVYDDSVDDIVGVLQIRKYLKAVLSSGAPEDLRPLLDKPYFVHKKTRIDDLLQEMSQKKIHLAVVTDDYGGTMGIVTMEDMLEELVGEIWDEDDVVKEEFMPIGGNRYEVSGDLAVIDAFERMGYENFDEEEIEHKTMGAWTLEHFDCIPKEGDTFSYRDLTVVIGKIDNVRITSLTVLFRPPEEGPPGSDAIA